MRIGYVLSTTPGYSETFLRSKIIGLQNAGYVVTLFINGGKAGRFEGADIIPGPKVHSNKNRQIVSMITSIVIVCLRAPLRTLRFLKLERADGNSLRTSLENLYLNSHILPQSIDWLHLGFLTNGLRKENVARAVGAKLSASIRGYDISIYPLKKPGCYEKLWIKLQKVHTISEDLIKVARKQGLPTCIPYEKITPAIDSSLFKCTNPAVKTIRNRPIKIMTVARLHWKKGLEYTFDALNRLKAAGHSFEYTLVGDGPEYERLIFAVYQFNLMDEVKFVGKKTPEEVKSLLSNADIYIQYSIQEGFCNAVLEAQAMGLLCIVSNAEGLPENVVNGKTGWVVPKREPALLAEKIEKILEMKDEKLNNIRKAAITRVENQFNLEKQKQEFINFFNL